MVYIYTKDIVRQLSSVRGTSTRAECTLKILSSSSILGPTTARVCAIMLHGSHHLHHVVVVVVGKAAQTTAAVESSTCGAAGGRGDRKQRKLLHNGVSRLGTAAGDRCEGPGTQKIARTSAFGTLWAVSNIV